MKNLSNVSEFGIELIAALNQEAHRNNVNDVYNLLRKENTIFSVKFARRTKGKNGEQIGDTREMVCRTKVKKFVTGKGLAFDPKEKSLIPVFDVLKQRQLIHEQRKANGGEPLTEDQEIAIGKKSYRMINLASCFEIKIRGIKLVRDTSQNWVPDLPF